MKTFGERLRELREGKDLSLRELARVLTVSAAFLSDVELGRRYPSDELLAKIAKRLQTSVDDLKTYDTRAPLDDLRRLAAANPIYGVAMRRIVERIDDEDMSPEELLKLINRHRRAERREE
ncbi:MAG: helix-turn-helix domain-containing protein [Gemmatimonadaceae bacterium]